MQTQVRKLDFSGQNIYVGLDTHRKQLSVTILSEQAHHKTYSQAPDATILTRYLKNHFPGANYYAAYEAGFSGFWLQEALQAEGINCIVVHPADVPTMDKERKRKSDPGDSRKIARSLRSGDLQSIHVPGKSCQQDRAFLRTRHSMVGNLTRCKNRIKSLLNFFGIPYPEEFTRSGTHWSNRFMKWLKTVDLGETGNEALNLYQEEAEFLRAQLTKITKKIRILSNQERYRKRVNLLIGVPGIGRLTAMIILTELGDIRRFKGLDNLCEYVGLVPNTFSSGESETIGELTRRGNKLLRKSLIESSWTARGVDPALIMKYNQLCKRMNANKAIIKIARMLLNRIRFILLSEQEYQLGVVA